MEQAHCLLFSGLEGVALRNCTGGLASQGCRSASTLEEVTKPGEADRDPNGNPRSREREALVLEQLFCVSFELSNFWERCGMCSLPSTWVSDFGTWAGVDRLLGPALPSLRPSSPSHALPSTSWPSELLRCPGQCCRLQKPREPQGKEKSQVGVGGAWTPGVLLRPYWCPVEPREERSETREGPWPLAGPCRPGPDRLQCVLWPSVDCPLWCA